MTLSDINPWFVLLLLVPLIGFSLGFLVIVVVSAFDSFFDWMDQ